MTSVAQRSNAQSGRIRWNVDVGTILSRNSYSPAIEVGEMPWRIFVRRDESGSGYLSLFLARMDGDYKVRSVRARMECMLINYHDEEKKTVVRKCEKTFDEVDCESGYKQFVKWNTAVDPEKGFIVDGCLTVQIEFSLTNVVGFRSIPRMNFGDSSERSHDIALIIEGEKVYASKSHLSIYSPVFHKLFFGDSVEKDQKEFELKDVNRMEFIEMLKVIYPPSKRITDENYLYLLKLGNRFEIELVVNLCEQFLITTPILTVASKLVLAGQYKLENLQDQCCSKMKNVKDVTALKKFEEAKLFTDAIKVALYEKILQF